MIRRLNWARLFRFGLVGIAATLTHWAIGLYLHEIQHIPAFYANLVAFSCATLISYTAHKSWTFQSDGSHKECIPKFVITVLSGLFLNQGIVYLMVNLLGHPYWIALSMILFIVPGATYLMFKFWVFEKSESA